MNAKFAAFMFMKFQMLQIDKIDKEKWYEGERRKLDPGEEFVMDWINQNSAPFRNKFNKSLCKTCAKTPCGSDLKYTCENYIREEIHESN